MTAQRKTAESAGHAVTNIIRGEPSIGSTHAESRSESHMILLTPPCENRSPGWHSFQPLIQMIRDFDQIDRSASRRRYDVIEQETLVQMEDVPVGEFRLGRKGSDIRTSAAAPDPVSQASSETPWVLPIYIILWKEGSEAAQSKLKMAETERGAGAIQVAIKRPLSGTAEAGAERPT